MSQVGIEPTTRGLKVPCSTTELLALFNRKSTSKHQQYKCGHPSPIHALTEILTVDGGRNDQ